MKDSLEILKNISKEEPSPFLYTRILQKIEERKWELITKKELFAIAIPSLCMLIITAIIIFNASSNHSDINTIANTMHLKGNYSLY